MCSQSEPPAAATAGGSSLFTEGHPPGLIVAMFSVKPLADIVADYTCYNGNDKRNKYRHALTPFLLPVWEATTK